MKTKGFALAEAMIAAVLVATLSLSLFAFFPPYKVLIAKSNRQFLANNLCRQTIEKKSWDAYIQTGSGEDSLPAGALGPGATNTTRKFSVTDDATGKYKIITTTVGWGS